MIWILTFYDIIIVFYINESYHVTCCWVTSSIMSLVAYHRLLPCRFLFAESDNLGSTDSEVKKILTLHLPISEYDTRDEGDDMSEEEGSDASATGESGYQGRVRQRRPGDATSVSSHCMPHFVFKQALQTPSFSYLRYRILIDLCV